jgi:putative ABC transport system permease protein
VRALLPAAVELEAAEGQAQRGEELLAAFRLNLFALSLLAMFVGAFLAFNAMQSAIVRRRALLGIARCLGATRRLVFLGFVSEALALGVVGTAVGVLLGHVLSRAIVAQVAETISSLYFHVRPGAVALAPATVMKAGLVGLLAVLAAVFFPAREAAAIAPRAALLRSLQETAFRAQVPRLLALGGAGALAALLLLAVWPSSIWPPLAASLAASLALACTVPFLAALLLPLVDRAAGMLSLTWIALAARTLERALSRTGAALAALTVALSMTVGVMVMIASFRDTVALWVDGHMRADVYLEPDRGGIAREAFALPDAVVERLERDPDITGCDLLRRASLPYQGAEIQVSGVRAPVLAAHARFRFKQGDVASAWRGLIAGDALISEILQNRTGKNVGDEIELRSPVGTARVRVAGVFFDYSVNQGLVLVDERRFTEIFGPRPVAAAALYLRPGVSAEDKARALQSELGADYALTIRANRALRAEVLRIFDRTFEITYVLQAIAVGMAVLGVATTLLSLAIEKARELATMRALGLSARRLALLHLSEGAILGGLCALASLGGGAVLAFILIRFVNLRSFGWSIGFTFPVGVWGKFIVLSVVAAMIASLVPALAMARRTIASGLRGEE